MTFPGTPAQQHSFFRDLMMNAFRKDYIEQVPVPFEPPNDYVKIVDFLMTADGQAISSSLLEAIFHALNNRPEFAIDSLLHFAMAVADQFADECVLRIQDKESGFIE